MISRNIRPRKLEGTQKIPIVKKSRDQEPELKLPLRSQDPKGPVSKILSNVPGHRLVKDPAIYNQKCLPLIPLEPYMDCIYEMTSKDEKWLQIFINNHSTRLSNEQFERMIKLLETANYEEYRRHHLTTTGEIPEMVQGSDVITILNHLKMKDAVDLLADREGTELPICEKFYLYWRKLRLGSGMPLLKKFQPQTQTTDTNPEKTFSATKTRATEPYEIKGSNSTSVMKSRFRRMEALTECMSMLHNTTILDTRIKMVQMAKSAIRNSIIMQRSHGNVERKRNEAKRIQQSLKAIDEDDRRYSVIYREKIKPLYGGNVRKMLMHSKTILPVSSAPNQFIEKYSERQKEDAQLKVALKEQHHADIIERRLVEEKCEKARLSLTEMDPDAEAIITYIDRDPDYLEKAGLDEDLEAWELQATYQREYENLKKRKFSASDVTTTTAIEPKQFKVGPNVDTPIESNDDDVYEMMEIQKRNPQYHKNLWERIGDKLEKVKTGEEESDHVLVSGSDKLMQEAIDMEFIQMTTRHTTAQQQYRRDACCEIQAISESSSTKEEDSKSLVDEPSADMLISHEALRKVHPGLHQLSSSERAKLEKLEQAYFNKDLKNVQKCIEILNSVKDVTPSTCAIQRPEFIQSEPFSEREGLFENRPVEKPVFKREIDKKAVNDAKMAFKAVENDIMSGKLQLLQPCNEDIINVPLDVEGYGISMLGSSGTANCIDWHYHDLDNLEQLKKIKNGKHRKIWTGHDLEDYAYANSPSSQQLKEFIFERRELLYSYDMANELYQNYQIVDVEPVFEPVLGKEMIQQGHKDVEAQNASLVPASTDMTSSQEKKALKDEHAEAQMKIEQQKRDEQVNDDMLLAHRLQKEEEEKYNNNKQQQQQQQQRSSAKKETISSGSGQEQIEEIPTARVVEEIEDNQSILALKSEDKLSCELINITDLSKAMAREVKRKHKLNRNKVSEIYKMTSSNPISKITKDSHDNLIALTYNDDQEQSKSYLTNVHTDTIKDIKVIHKKVTTLKKSRMDALTDPETKLKEITGEIEEIQDDCTFDTKLGQQQLSQVEYQSHHHQDKELIQKALIEKEPFITVLGEDVSRKWIFDDLISTLVEYVKVRNEDDIKTSSKYIEEEDKAITFVNVNDVLIPEQCEEAIYHHSKSLVQHRTLGDDFNLDDDDDEELELRMGRNKQIYTCGKSMNEVQEEIEEEDHVETTYKEKVKEFEEKEVSENQIMQILEHSGRGPTHRTRQRKRQLEEIMSTATGEEFSQTKRKNKKKPN